MSTVNATAEPQYYLEQLSASFDAGCAQLASDLNDAQIDLNSDPSNPAYLASYQAKMQEYELYRSAQSSVVKAFKDTDATTIQHFG